ncbi:MAG: class I SAM-dependent methyltransferase [Candidatus Vogelbacteria bacterium]|nr:class I SAM-dependent methyltransferase [Candidatus Vogelbacteria bacterium]
MNQGRHPIKTVEDIPFFSEDRYWGKAPKEELEKAVSLIVDKGWDEFQVVFKDKFDATFEENRADWRFVIPVSKDFTVLDAGAGMGRISIPLARVVKKVVALDQSFLRMKFLKLRAGKEGLTNIEVNVGDIFDRPFPNESFDLIVMNGLLEWVGATNRFKNPREAQIVSLRIAKDLLKKGGYLYIGIENRIAAANLKAIDHSGLRFTSYMPRFIADIYMKILKGRRYDTYTYSRKGYIKLIKESGFDLSNIEFYLPFPGYNLPRLMIPHNNLYALRFAIESIKPPYGLKGRAIRILVTIPLVLRLYRYLFFSFGIVIKK